MERDRDALKTLKENIAQTDPTSCEVFSGDSFANISQVIARLKKSKQKAYFYIDPPFSIREGMEDIYDKTMDLIKSLPTEIVEMIIIEHMSGLKIPQKLSPYTIKKSKKFGNTTLTYLVDENME
jgi:16S rRNA G966 N2-methylase RsmD